MLMRERVEITGNIIKDQRGRRRAAFRLVLRIAALAALDYLDYEGAV